MKKSACCVIGAVLIGAMRTTRVAADLIPGFPDPRAPSTIVLIACLVFAAFVSGISFFLLKRMQKARNKANPPSGNGDNPARGDSGQAADSSGDHVKK
jgi:hypothetical protein